MKHREQQRDEHDQQQQAATAAALTRGGHGHEPRRRREHQRARWRRPSPRSTAQHDDRRDRPGAARTPCAIASPTVTDGPIARRISASWPTQARAGSRDKQAISREAVTIADRPGAPMTARMACGSTIKRQRHGGEQLPVAHEDRLRLVPGPRNRQAAHLRILPAVRARYAEPPPHRATLALPAAARHLCARGRGTGRHRMAGQRRARAL